MWTISLDERALCIKKNNRVKMHKKNKIEMVDVCVESQIGVKR